MEIASWRSPGGYLPREFLDQRLPLAPRVYIVFDLPISFLSSSFVLHSGEICRQYLYLWYLIPPFPFTSPSPAGPDSLIREILHTLSSATRISTDAEAGAVFA